MSKGAERGFSLSKVIRSVSQPGTRIHVLKPVRPGHPLRSHPPLVAPGMHDHYEVAVCCEGEAMIVGDSSTLDLHRGDAVLVMPGAWHYESYRQTRRPYAMYWLIASSRSMTHTFSSYRRGVFRTQGGGGIPVVEENALLRNLVCEAVEQPPHWRVKARSLLVELLIEFDRGMRGQTLAPPVREMDPVQKLRRIVESRFREPLQIKFLSREAGLSTDHLSRRFHAECGMKFKGYLNAIRIHHAQLLLKSGWTIKQTADECGFSNVYYFGRVFKERCSVSPGQFVRSLIRRGRDGDQALPTPRTAVRAPQP